MTMRIARYLGLDFERPVRSLRKIPENEPDTVVGEAANGADVVMRRCGCGPTRW
jgi:hypothetical protein